MKWVSTGAQCRELDRRLIAAGVPGVALMETAAHGLAAAIAEKYAMEARRGVVIVCGGGNNGGDGYGCARWLAAWGFEVRLWHMASASRGDAAVFRAVCDRLRIPSVQSLENAGVVVDAIFGTGLDRPLNEEVSRVTAQIAAFPGPVVSADLPTGIHSDTGMALGIPVRATMTVTFGRLKAGLLTGDGLENAGEVRGVDLGQDGVATAEDHIASVSEAESLAKEWPQRGKTDHKNRSGHLLLVAGSERMAGAAVLAARGALAAGVGLLTLATPRDALVRLAGLPAEAMWIPLEEGLSDAALVGRTAWAAGPGLGALGEPILRRLQELWAAGPLPAVWDADLLAALVPSQSDQRVITPHPGEAARILAVQTAEIQGDRFGAARRLTQGRTALLKGRNTLVASPDGQISVNPTNSPVLGTGGSGDVLLGVIGGLLARGVDAATAARLGAWVHGRAGELLENQRSNGWTASDIAERVPVAIDELLSIGPRFP